MKKYVFIGVFLVIILWYGISVYIDTVDNKNRETAVNNYINSSDNKLVMEDNTSNKYDYILVLEIPEIALFRGVLSVNNPYNSVDYNIMMLKESTMPDKSNNNLILASHNGNTKISFFKDLEKLNNGSTIYIYYNHVKYGYKIADIYTILKTGTGEIKRDRYQNTITLITCKNNSDTEQIIFIGYLFVKEMY